MARVVPSTLCVRTLDYRFSKVYMYFAAQFTWSEIQLGMFYNIKYHEKDITFWFKKKPQKTKKHWHWWKLKVYKNMSPTSSMMCHVTLDNLCEIYLFIQRNPNLKGVWPHANWLFKKYIYMCTWLYRAYYSFHVSSGVQLK